MKKLTFTIQVLLITLFVSCNGTTNKKEQQIGNSIELKEEGSFISKETVEIEGKRLQPRFKVKEYCKMEDHDTVYYYMDKFGTRIPFEISVKKYNNTLIIRYRIIDDCCLKFGGKAGLDKANLSLFNKNIGDEVCECICMYEFEFLIRNTNKPDKLFINKEEVQF